MHALLKKLNHRPPAPVVVLGAPPELDEVLRAWAAEVPVRTSPEGGDATVVAFVRSSADIAETAPAVVAALEATPDPLLWMAYPKKSSTRYRSDISRDHGWQALDDLGFEPVRQVAVDEDWSALRFRRVEHIRELRRDPSGALSAEGRRRAGGDGER